MAELSGKVAMVTGSSSGIGRAIALELARAGADVIVHARASESSGQEVADEIASLQQRSKVILHDLAHTKNLESLVEQAWSWSDGIDIWVNNAGADVLTGERANMSFGEKLEYLWQVDVAGTIQLSRRVGNRMLGRQRGVIINMGWDQAQQGMAGDSGEMFSAIKGAVMAFSRSLAQTLAPYVRVNCLSPGWIKTSWGVGASDYWHERAINESLLARWGTPEDVAQVARFLAGPSAEFITGQIVNINGGFKFGESEQPDCAT